MEKIKLHFCDFWNCHTYENDFFVDILKDKYEIVLDSKNPDFVVCSCYGYEYRKYNCPRIFYSGENITPDFNVYDYAISFDRLSFGDRYLRVPIYYFFDKIREKIPMPKEPQKREFCSFLYSNGVYCDDIRIKFFHLLSKYKKVSSGGKLLNNEGKIVSDKVDYLSRYKFSIAFENTSSEDYVTEKIYDAFLAHTIPIYWGDKNVVKDFNSDAFINVNDYASLDEVVEKIIELDNDDEKYLKMLNTPYLINGKFADDLSDEKILGFFDNVFKNKGVLYRNDKNNSWDKNGRFYLYSKFQRGVKKKVSEFLLKR